ncbi:hypothetical protein B0H63DRAFT_472869 [Podospora didyma]|uniref:Uncharacterized protein n=1 Tax=Podospora didyma TaxID=330526 RepID=A0AAE0NPR4_9PEZI|nr:hypothetical protein B0H63DRAFT_472869 [Podospora didyma]
MVWAWWRHSIRGPRSLIYPALSIGVFGRAKVVRVKVQARPIVVCGLMAIAMAWWPSLVRWLRRFSVTCSADSTGSS